MAELHRNTFEGGLDTNLTKTVIGPNKYIEGLNINLTEVNGANNFFSLENIAGTTAIKDLLNNTFTNKRIIGVFNSVYIVQPSATKEQGLTIFSTYTDTGVIYLQIQAYIVASNTLYDLYRQAVPSDYVTNNIVIDAISYSENNFDYLYFTDNYYQPKKLKCEIPPVYSANFLNSRSIEFLRPKALGLINLSTITTGGSLLTGSYQIAYQLVNADKTKFTAFSLLTNPIHVYTSINSLVRAGIGLPSSKKIRLNIVLTENEVADYTYFRLAIVENINPSGVVNTDIGVTGLESISTYLSGNTITAYDIKSNYQLTTIPLDEIIVDLVAIEKLVSLRIRDNRLLLANATLKDLTYNNGTPSIGASTILQQAGSNDSFSSDIFSSNYKGHFRDEVYRFAISYFDAYGNFSFPKVLDCSGVQDNQISGSTDMKFPSRSFTTAGRYYSLFDASNNTISLGLRLVNITNHPTWAKGFVILRAKRKKNIKFQTPVLPLTSLYGIGAVGLRYPTIYETSSGEVTNTTAVPMGPSTVLMPPNLFYGAPVSSSVSSFTGGVAPNTKTPGESLPFSFQATYTQAMIFPPESIYNNTIYSFTGSEQVKVVDAPICRLYLNKFDSSGFNLGTTDESSCSGSFFASLNNDYYYNHGHGGSKAALQYYGGNRTIVNSKFFDNYSTGTILGSTPINDTTKLETTNVALGTVPVTQRAMAVEFDYLNIVYSGPYKPGGITWFWGDPVFKPSVFTGLLDDSSYITSTTGLYGSYVNAIEISNILQGYADDRYGSAENFNEYIYTGTKVVFTNAEVASNISTAISLPKTVDVWGGDCIVSPHCFKLTDNNYTIVNSGKAIDTGETDTVLKTKWKKIWLNVGGASSVIMLPAPVKKSAQYLTVVLESEYHGSVRDIDTYNTVGTYNFPIYGAINEGQAGTPLNYKYNINLNKENDQKIFVPQNQLSTITTHYPARVYFSDQKIYNSTIQGFDITRVLNYKDFPEKFGGITSLALAGDNLYSIHTNGILYIPVGQRIIETGDASQLSIQSGAILGEPVIIDTVRGGLHLKGIKETGDEIFITDQINKDVYKLSGQKLETIVKDTILGNATTVFNFGTTIDNTAIITGYDYYRDHFWLYNRALGKAYIYNNRFGLWQGAYEFPSYLKGLSFNMGVYVIGDNQRVGDENKLSLETMYTGPRTSLFGTYVTPSVSFVVNPSPDFSKSFDDLLINSTNPLATADIFVERNTLLSNQVSNNLPINVTTRGEGNYMVKTLRDANGSRLRGLYADIKLKWPSSISTPKTLLTSVLTTFRPSR